MIGLELSPNSCTEEVSEKTQKKRRFISGDDPTVLADIYKEDVNIVVWKNKLPKQLKELVKEFIESKPNYQKAMSVSPDSALKSLTESFGEKKFARLAEKISQLVDMFCYLFEIERVGLRLSVLNQAMCPKFHVDRVPCRLVCTLDGEATEWIPHQFVDRSKLGSGSKGMADEDSGLYSNSSQIHSLESGDVALLKGESWVGNENAGLVHRSPTLLEGNSRLLLTLDFGN